MKIQDIMTKGVKTVGPEEDARSIYKKYSEEGIHHIVVVENGKVVGILSTNDYRGVTHGKTKGGLGTPEMIFGGLLVRNLMTENPMTLSSQADLAEAAKAMLEKDFNSLPIVDGGKLVGIVTANDILRAVSAGKLRG